MVLRRGEVSYDSAKTKLQVRKCVCVSDLLGIIYIIKKLEKSSVDINMRLSASSEICFYSCPATTNQRENFQCSEKGHGGGKLQKKNKYWI